MKDLGEKLEGLPFVPIPRSWRKMSFGLPHFGLIRMLILILCAPEARFGFLLLFV